MLYAGCRRANAFGTYHAEKAAQYQSCSLYVSFRCELSWYKLNLPQRLRAVTVLKWNAGGTERPPTGNPYVQPAERSVSQR